MAQPSKPHHNILFRIFFLDLLFERRSRTILIYALATICSGAFLYHWLEGWGWIDSFYFVVITLTTIGYGDLHPTRPATKLLTIFFALNGIAIIFLLFDIMRNERGQHIVVPTQEVIPTQEPTDTAIDQAIDNAIDNATDHE